MCVRRPGRKKLICLETPKQDKTQEVFDGFKEAFDREDTGEYLISYSTIVDEEFDGELCLKLLDMLHTEADIVLYSVMNPASLRSDALIKWRKHVNRTDAASNSEESSTDGEASQQDAG